MNIKRYIAKDMAEAMVKIRNQLGPDAMILSDRPLRKKGLAGWFSKPLVEVVVAYEFEPKKDAKAAAAAAGDAAQGKPEASAPGIDNKILEVEKRLESVTAAVTEIATHLKGKGTGQRYSPPIQQRYTHLIDCEVEEGIARSIADEAQDISDRRKADPAEAFEQVLRLRLGDSEGIKLQRFKRTVAVFVGPTGAGKTTTIAKLAARYALHEKLKVGIVTADAYRIAAHEQIKTYSEILEVPLKVVYKVEDIVQALNEMDNTDIVLVDTPGKSPTDKTHAEDIAALVEKSGATEVFLCVSAATGYKSCQMVADQYRFLKDFKVLLTKMDETVAPGAALNVRALTGKRLSYITNGQSVPDDIEVLDVAAVCTQLTGGQS